MNANFKTIKEAEAIVGGLSRPSKMPGWAYGIPAEHCKLGSILREVPNSVCSRCYARKGRYVFPNVSEAQRRRFESLQHPLWTEAMVFLINQRKVDYFRWHDSGDLQSVQHLENIAEIARRCPKTKFWLPTKEQKFFRDWLKTNTLPDNLIVRLSALSVDGKTVQWHPNTSMVTRHSMPTCPAPLQEGRCDKCRMCWDKGIRTIIYKEH